MDYKENEYNENDEIVIDFQSPIEEIEEALTYLSFTEIENPHELSPDDVIESRPIDILFDHVIHGHLQPVQDYIENGGDIEVNLHQYGGTMLHVAVWYGHRHIVEYLLSKEINVDSREDCNRTPLHTSIYAKVFDILIVQMLLDKEANINAVDNQGDNVLHICLQKRNFDMIPFFIERGANINHQNVHGTTPFLKTINYQMHDIANDLIDKVDVHLSSIHGCNAFYLAVTHHFDIEFLEKLFQLEVNIEQPTSSGLTALHFACMYNREDVVEWMISKNVNVNVLDGDNRSPLYLAFESGNKEIVDMLISAGADTNVENFTTEFPPKDKIYIGRSNQPI